MKIKYFILFLVCLFPVVVLFMKSNAMSKKTNKYKTLPSFSLVDITGGVFSESDLKKNTPILFMFFNTECEICKTEILQLNNRKDEFRDAEIVLISIQPVDKVNNYLNEINFIPDSNIHILIDENLELISSMDINGSPVSLIYDINGTLIKRFNGFVKIETLLFLLTKNNYGNNSN